MLELGGIVVLGILAQWLAWRTRVPAILPLIIMGLIVGPIAQEFFGGKIIDPIYDGEHGLFTSDTLFNFVALAIGIILFEGGLTLQISEVGGIRNAIIRLISVGSAITFVAATLALKFIMPALSWPICLLFASLIIVTGPTVVAPILRNVPLNKNVATVLKWEGILIDPVGALVAVLVFEFVVSSGAHHGGGGHHGGGTTIQAQAFITFIQIVAVGFMMGWLGAITLSQLIKRKLVPEYLLNLVTLALVMFVFMMSDFGATESGLLAVVVMGMMLGNMNIPHIKEILHFKETLTVLLISILFIVLSANMNWSDLELLQDWRCAALLAIVVLVIRPLAVFASTTNSELTFNEKLFISWVGPRGIVAAGIASLFGLSLVKDGVEGANMITPLVFLIVLGTVLLNATTARIVARLLGVTAKSDGILIVGANKGARILGKYLQENGRHVVLLDNSLQMVAEAKAEGLEALRENVFNDKLGTNFDLLLMGNVIAMTASHDVNVHAAEGLTHVMGDYNGYRIMSSNEYKDRDKELGKHLLFSPKCDYINFSEVARDYPTIHELPLENETQLQELLAETDANDTSIPLFIKHSNNKLDMLTALREDLVYKDGDILVYFGKELA